MKQKPNFDGATQKFSRCIYESAKGKVRLAILKRDLAKLRDSAPLRVLDVGAGLGHMSLWFAEAGHQLVLCDVSEQMLTEVEAQANKLGLAERMSFYHCGLEALPQEVGRFDLVICHAVLEWIEEQQDFVRLLAHRVNPNGHLSLMAFNRNALLFNHLVAGNFEYVTSGMKRRSRQRLTPNWPVDPEQLNGWLKECQLETQTLSGVRVFSDYVRDKSLVEQQEKSVLELELQYSSAPSFLPVARYLHYLLQLT